MFGSSSKKKKSNVGLDKSGLTAYGTLFKQDDDAGQAEPEVKPLMETAQETMANAMAAAKLSGAKDYMESQLASLKDLTSKGPMTIRAMALAGGCAMVAQCFMGSLGKLFSFSPLAALIEVYCGIFGVMVVILEGQDFSYLKRFRSILNENAKFLTFTWGRGLFYMFAGSLMVSQFNLFDMAIGGWMCFVGFTSVVVGATTANKLTDLKLSLASEKVVKEKFQEMDADGSGNLDSKELAQLCKSLGSSLDHNELEAALMTMDCNKDGQISFDEFMGWWAGWKHEKDDLKGQFAV